MTMIDEGLVRTLLAGAADGYPVPEGATERVAAAAAGDAPKTAVIRSIVPTGRWARTALVAALVVLIAGVVTIVGVPSGTGRHTTAGPSIPAPANPGVAPTTTVPSNSQAGAGASGGLSRPSAQGGGFATSSPTQAAPATGPPVSTLAPLPPGIVGQPAKVVTTGTIDLALGDSPVGPAVNKLTTIATGAGGFVAKSGVQVGPSSSAAPSSATLVLQIPQAAYASVVSQVQTIGKVTSMTSTSNDVTGQYVDLQARISALQASRQQYLTILSKATSIGDILAVQSQLDSIQSQIEQLQGQLNLLDGQTTYATLTVSLSQSGHRPPPPPAPQSGIGRAWHQSVTGFTSGVEWLVRIAGRTLFVLVCLAVLAIAGRWAWRAWRRRML